MIKFFKVNDPYRFGILALAFILIRGIIFSFGTSLTQIELPFFLAARTISEGKWIYRDIWEITEPLTTLVYYLLPKSPSGFSVISYWINVIIILFNAFYANYFLQKFDIFLDKTFLPALFYLLLSLVFFELNVLSSHLLASTFLLFALNNIFSFLKKEDNYRMYDAGFFLGTASLFFLPCIAFIPAVLVAMLVFTRSHGKGYLLFLLGFIFPWAIIAILYLWIEGLQEFTGVFLRHYFSVFQDFNSSYETLLALLLPLCLFLVGVIFSFRGNLREINFQSISRKFLVIWMLGALLGLLITPAKSFSILYIFIFPLIFFYTFYFFTNQKVYNSKPVYDCFYNYMHLSEYRCLKGTIWQKSIFQFTVNQAHDITIDNKKIWVTGKNQDPYLYAYTSGKYLNWDVSQDDWANIDKFYAVENIRKNFEKDVPEVILDKAEIMPKIFNKIPLLQRRYKKGDNNLYILYRKE